MGGGRGVSVGGGRGVSGRGVVLYLKRTHTKAMCVSGERGSRAGVGACELIPLDAQHTLRHTLPHDPTLPLTVTRIK